MSSRLVLWNGDGALGNCSFEAVEELCAEESAEDADGEEEPRSRTHPARTVGTETAPGDEAVQMRMEEQILPPGVQDGGKADLRAEMLFVKSNFFQCLRSRIE